MQEKVQKKRKNEVIIVEGLIGYCITVLIAIIGMKIYKKLEPEKYRFYVGYVIGILILGALILEPWRGLV